jgi:hypothetical protein
VRLHPTCSLRGLILVGSAGVEIILAIYMLLLCCCVKRRVVNDGLKISVPQEKFARKLFEDIELWGLDDKVLERAQQPRTPSMSANVVRRSLHALRQSILPAGSTQAPTSSGSDSRTPKIFEASTTSYKKRTRSKRPKNPPPVPPVADVDSRNTPPSHPQSAHHASVRNTRAPPQHTQQQVAPAQLPFEDVFASYRRKPEESGAGKAEMPRWTAIYATVDQMARPEEQERPTIRQRKPDSMLEDLLAQTREAPPTALRPAFPILDTSTYLQDPEDDLPLARIPRHGEEQVIHFDADEASTMDFTYDAAVLEEAAAPAPESPKEHTPFSELAALLGVPADPGSSRKSSRRNSPSTRPADDTAKPSKEKNSRKSPPKVKVVRKSSKKGREAAKAKKPQHDILQELDAFLAETAPGLTNAFDSVTMSQARHFPKLVQQQEQAVSRQASVDTVDVGHAAAMHDSVMITKQREHKSHARPQLKSAMRQHYSMDELHTPASSNRAVFSAMDLPTVPPQAATKERHVRSMVSPREQNAFRVQSFEGRPRREREREVPRKSRSRSSKRGTEEGFRLDASELTAKLDMLAGLGGEEDEDEMEELKPSSYKPGFI